MPAFTLDSNCLIAAVCTWHEHHQTVADDIEARLIRRERLVVVAQALVEAYAVLTCLPAPHRLAPADAWALLEANFVRRRRLTALQARAYARLLDDLARQEVGGGRTHDALIAECARLGGVTHLLTFNRRHFDPPSAGLLVVEPGAGRPRLA